MALSSSGLTENSFRFGLSDILSAHCGEKVKSAAIDGDGGSDLFRRRPSAKRGISYFLRRNCRRLQEQVPPESDRHRPRFPRCREDAPRRLERTAIGFKWAGILKWKRYQRRCPSDTTRRNTHPSFSRLSIPRQLGRPHLTATA